MQWQKRLLLVSSIFVPLWLLIQRCDAVRFIAVSDTHVPYLSIFEEYVQAALSDNVDFIIIAGDVVDGYCDTQAELEAQLTAFINMAQPLYDLNIGVYPIRGNHDVGWVDDKKQAWDNIFSGSYALPPNGPLNEENITYFFNCDNVLIIGLDVYGSHWHRVNQAWLDEQLSNNKFPHIFLFAHEAAFTFHPDCLAGCPTERNAFWSSIAMAGGKTYICGHDHIYDHARLDDGDGDPNNDLHQFIVGGQEGSDSPPPYFDYNAPWEPQRIYYEQQYGYLLVDINGLDVTMTWKHRVDPNVYSAEGDVFTYSAKAVPSDFDLNGYVSMNDLAFLSLHWLDMDCNDISGDMSDWCFGTDLNKNGIVNLYDFAEFAFYWIVGN